MKTEMNFNHEADSMLEALGIKMTDVELGEATIAVITLWASKANGASKSELAEELHKGLPYEAILLLATKEILNTLKESISESNSIDRLLETLEMVIRKGDERIGAN